MNEHHERVDFEQMVLGKFIIATDLRQLEPSKIRILVFVTRTFEKPRLVDRKRPDIANVWSNWRDIRSWLAFIVATVRWISGHGAGRFHLFICKFALSILPSIPWWDTPLASKLSIALSDFNSLTCFLIYDHMKSNIHIKDMNISREILKANSKFVRIYNTN